MFPKSSARLRFLILAAIAMGLGVADSIGSTSTNPIADTLAVLQPKTAGGAPVDLVEAMDNLAVTAMDVIKESMLWSHKLHETIRADAVDIAATLLFAVLFAEITFTGFRLMLGSSIIEQLGRLTTKTFIYVIVSGLIPVPGAPAPYNSVDGIIRSTMYRMMHGGKYVGTQIIKRSAHPQVLEIEGIQDMSVDASDSIPDAGGFPPTAGGGSSWLGAPFSGGTDQYGRPLRFTGAGSGYGDAGAFGPNPGAAGTASPAGRAEPFVYWMTWIGVEYANKYSYDESGHPKESDAELIRDTPRKEYKYSQLSLNSRIWGEDPTSPTQAVSSRLREKAKDNLKTLKEKEGSTGAGGVSTWEDIARGTMTGMMPLQMFGMAMTVAGIQIGSLVTVLFTQIGILVGSITAFNLASALGLAVLPLMYFAMFDKIWSQYLVTLASLGMIPCLYYILSAVGFVFSTFLFEQLFPLPRNLGGTGVASLAVILNDLFFAAVGTTMNSFSLFVGALGEWFKWGVASLISVYLILGRILFGTTIVAAFVSAGAIFATLAPRFAFRWTQAFGAEDIVEKVGEAFTGIQSAVGSGMGQMYADALQRGSSMVKGGWRGGG
jgi:hypothetical protein